MMKRILLIGGGVVALLVVALVVFLFTGLGAAIKAIVETVGSEVTKVDVRLASADVSLTSGEGELKGLVVGNPKGYNTPSAIELGAIKVKLDTSTVTSDTIVVKEVLIDGPHLTYELGPGGSNIGVIQSNVESFGGGGGGAGSSDRGSGGGGGGGRGGKAAPRAKEEGGRKVIIEKLLVTNGRVDVSASFLKGKALGAGLDKIELHDIGKASGGATASEVAQEVLSALTSSAMKAVANLDVEGLKKGAADAVDNAVDSVKGLLGGGKKKNK
jgi:hypothetical protein